jgi:hypothetical protein
MVPALRAVGRAVASRDAVSGAAEADVPCGGGVNWGRWMAVAMGTECAIAMVYYASRGQWRDCLYWLGCVICYIALAK